jgi:lactoylglutathione lyase
MRVLHTMIRVVDLKKSITFYQDVLGMKIIKQKDYPAGKFTLVFMGYGPEEEGAVIELTHNWETDSYDIGNGFGHVAIGVDDIYHCCKQAKAKGADVTREPGPMKHGTTVIAFIKDPDGYMIELIEK